MRQKPTKTISTSGSTTRIEEISGKLRFVDLELFNEFKVSVRREVDEFKQSHRRELDELKTDVVWIRNFLLGTLLVGILLTVVGAVLAQ